MIHITETQKWYANLQVGSLRYSFFSPQGAKNRLKRLLKKVPFESDRDLQCLQCFIRFPPIGGIYTMGGGFSLRLAIGLKQNLTRQGENTITVWLKPTGFVEIYRRLKPYGYHVYPYGKETHNNHPIRRLKPPPIVSNPLKGVK